ncbi:MAG: hypothetical protein JW990_12920 [Thermoleophilia bacterium]|nr:hypothetical protein [Thermoleophilia bacterium]
MSQRTMTANEYITWTDILSQVIQVLLTAKGAEATESTGAYYAAAFRNAITALSEDDEAEVTADFIDVAIALLAEVERENAIQSMFSRFNAAVTSHLGSDVNTLLTNAGLRVHHYWKRAGNLQILAANTFPPITTMGTFAATGSGAGTWTEDPDTEGEIDTSLYGGAQLEVEVINQTLGAAAITVTVTGTDANGDELEKASTEIPAESVVGTKADVGTAADKFATVTSVAIAGGTNGDDLRIQSKEDRTLS